MRLRFDFIAFDIAGMAMALFVQSSYAIQSFNDGQSHSITSMLQSNISVTNKTEVIVNTDGWIRAASSQLDIVAAQIQDSSKVSILDGSITSSTSGPGKAIGIQGGESSTFNISGGELQAITSGPGDAIGFRGDGSSTIKMTGGQIRVTTSEPGSSYGAILSGSSSFSMSGGSITSTTNAPLTYGIIANDNAKVWLSGGIIVTTTPSAPVDPDLIFNGLSRLLIFGKHFNYPIGIPIADLSGTISGTLADNTNFSYVFTRGPSATIILVPEPSGIMLLILGVLQLSNFRRPTANRNKTFIDLQ